MPISEEEEEVLQRIDKVVKQAITQVLYYCEPYGLVGIDFSSNSHPSDYPIWKCPTCLFRLLLNLTYPQDEHEAPN